MSASSYKIKVKTPCSGDQFVNKVIDTYYTGTTGDFTDGTLALPPGATKWVVEIVDYSGGNCSPSIRFEQRDGDTSDPEGEYDEIGSGTGEVRVDEHP